MRALVRFTLVCLMMGGGSPARAQDDVAATWEELRDQGVLYYKRDHYQAARDPLEKAFATPEGRADFTTAYYRGLVAHKRLLLETAFEMAELAAKLAGEDEDKKARVEELRAELDGLYGRLDVRPAEEETNRRGRIYLEASTGIINREKRQVFESIRERFRSMDVELPTAIYLPHGSYRANNVPFTLEPGTPAAVDVFLQIREVPPPADDGISGWWLVGAGGAAAVAAGVAAVLLLGGDDGGVQDRARPRLVNP